MNDNKYGQPILGGGKYRREGQKIGEMELSEVTLLYVVILRSKLRELLKRLARSSVRG